MTKYFLLIIFFSFNLLAQEGARSVVQLEKETDVVDPLFAGEPLPEPEFHTPSAVEVWIRANGLHLLYKYFAFQDWVVDRVKRNIYSFKVMRYTP